MPQIVYILTNDAMPDLIKIGMTTASLRRRIRNLSRASGVPLPFRCYYACEVKNARDTENRLHMGLHVHQVAKEFFRISPEPVKILLEGYGSKDVTPSVNEEQIAKSPVFRFSMVDISPGAELSFIRDKQRTATVHDDKKINFEGRTSSLSKIALELMKDHDGKERKSVRGPDFWLYESETLTDRKIRMNNEEND